MTRREQSPFGLLCFITFAVPVGLILAAPVMRGGPLECESRLDFVIGGDSGKARLGTVEVCRRNGFVVSKTVEPLP